MRIAIDEMGNVTVLIPRAEVTRNMTRIVGLIENNADLDRRQACEICHGNGEKQDPARGSLGGCLGCSGMGWKPDANGVGASHKAAAIERGRGVFG